MCSSENVTAVCSQRNPLHQCRGEGESRKGVGGLYALILAQWRRDLAKGIELRAMRYYALKVKRVVFMVE